MRTRVLSRSVIWLSGDKVLAVAGSRIAQAQPTPMDIGAVNDEAAVAADTWGDASLVIEGEQDSDQIKGQGKGIQCYRCGGYGHVSRMCATPMPDKGCQKGQGKGYGDFGKGYDVKGKGADVKGGGKGALGKETRVCYNCNKLGHLSKDCWAKGGGKGKGKNVNEVSDGNTCEVGGVWMIAAVEGKGRPLTAEDMRKRFWMLNLFQ